MICVTTLPALPLSYYCPPVNIKPSPESQKLNSENPGRNLQCRTPPVSSSSNISDDVSPQSYAQAYLLILLYLNTELIKPMASSPLLENSQRRQEISIISESPCLTMSPIDHQCPRSVKDQVCPIRGYKYLGTAVSFSL